MKEWGARCIVCRIVFGSERSRAGIEYHLRDYQRMHTEHRGEEHRLEVVSREPGEWSSAPGPGAQPLPF